MVVALGALALLVGVGVGTFVGGIPKAGGPIQWLALLLTETPFVQLAGPTPYSPSMMRWNG
jgi:hypothetical protein